MSIEAPYPELDELLTMIGEAGQRMSEIEATEGAAGNISVYIGWQIDPCRRFPLVETIPLPDPVPELANKSFLVTGSGRRLPEIIRDTVANLGCVTIDEGGRTGKFYTAPQRLFAHPTSEFNSHLAVHRDQVSATSTNFQALIHAQPPHLTYLSHIAAYRDEGYLNRHLLRWEPETIYQFPEGIGILPFLVPGSSDLMRATTEAMRQHRVVIWSKHGVLARSDKSLKQASDYIEYAEAGARYEYMDLVSGGRGEGLTVEEIREICSALKIEQSIF
jgi:rhamnulose-1-phosphate aldolase